jgi:hypothetical protein
VELYALDLHWLSWIYGLLANSKTGPMIKGRNFTIHVMAGSLIAASLLSSASAQETDPISRHVLDHNKRLDQNEQSEGSPLPGRANDILGSVKPSIDCSKTKTPLGVILCSDENAAWADWAVNGAAWAYAYTLEPNSRKAFWERHAAWIQSIFPTCSLTSPISPAEVGCVVRAYRAPAVELRSTLTGGTAATYSQWSVASSRCRFDRARSTVGLPNEIVSYCCRPQAGVVGEPDVTSQSASVSVFLG